MPNQNPNSPKGDSESPIYMTVTKAEINAVLLRLQRDVEQLQKRMDEVFGPTRASAKPGDTSIKGD